MSRCDSHTFRGWRGEKGEDISAATRLSDEADLLGVTPECPNVLLHPTEGQLEVEDRIVTTHSTRIPLPYYKVIRSG